MSLIKSSIESSVSSRPDFNYEAFKAQIPGVLAGDANAINSLAALVDNSRNCYWNNKTTEDFLGSTLDTRNLLTMEKLDGSEQYRLYRLSLS